jgi:hypothetical protein
MKTLVAVAACTLALFSLSAAAADSCADQAAAKKLAGAAKNSFMKKCEKDMAADTCGAQAADKKLAGAAKNSFVKKCVKDMAASAPKA